MKEKADGRRRKKKRGERKKRKAGTEVESKKANRNECVNEETQKRCLRTEREGDNHTYIDSYSLIRSTAIRIFFFFSPQVSNK